MPGRQREMPVFAKPPADVAALFAETLPDVPVVVRKLVFGSPSAVVNGNMFAGTWGSRLVVRLPSPAMEELLTLAGAEPFEPMPGRRMSGFALLPEALHSDLDAVRGWFDRAFAAAIAMPPKETKPRKVK